MSSASIASADAGFPPAARARARFWFAGLAAAAAWSAAAAVTWAMADIDDFDRTGLLAQIAAGIAALLLLAALASRAGLPARLLGAGPWLVLTGVALTAWELVTAKYPVLPPPVLRPPRRRCWRSSPTTTPAWAAACGTA